MIRFITIFLVLFGMMLSSSLQAQGLQDWVTPKNHDLVKDTEGFQFPVEIAFVPQPGKNPKDPLYFVTELRGTIKVVTNDRTILTYAEQVNSFKPPTELPNELAEVGLAGLCLDPINGYLFATTAYHKRGTFYNKIVRFEHDTKDFAVKPKSFVEFTRIFDNDESTNSHQIGKCIISSDHLLYVGVGDGHEAYKAQGLAHPNGKILRMHLDFSAVAQNPFYNAKDPQNIAGYVFVYGLRNPFPITLDDKNQLYIADNGPNRDRLIEAVAGKNYLWDGSNDSMRGDGIWHWSGSVGPAGAIYLGEGTRFPYWKNRLIIAQGGSIQDPGPSRNGKVTLNSFPVKAGLGMVGKPEYILSYKGTAMQLLVAVAEGHDGLYFANFFPDAQGVTAIYKIVPKQGAGLDAGILSGSQLYRDKGCDGCHKISGEGGVAGPALDGLIDRLQIRLNSPEYLKQLDEVDASEAEVHQKYREVRHQIRDQQGPARLDFWLRHRLAEPRFDQAQSMMPNLQLKADEIEALTAFLLTLKNAQQTELNPSEEWHRRFKVWWDTEYNARPLVGFALGLIAAVLIQTFWRKWIARKR